MQASILLHNSLLKQTAGETFLPWIYLWLPPSEVTSMHMGKGKDAVLHRSKGDAGGIKCWHNNWVDWFIPITYFPSQIFRCLCLCLAKATVGPVKVWLPGLCEFLISFFLPLTSVFATAAPIEGEVCLGKAIHFPWGISFIQKLFMLLSVSISLFFSPEVPNVNYGLLLVTFPRESFVWH